MKVLKISFFAFLTLLVCAAALDATLWTYRFVKIRTVHADEPQPTNSWLIFHGNGYIVTKIQDGNCSLYVASPTGGGSNGTIVPSIATGQGCK